MKKDILRPSLTLGISIILGASLLFTVVYSNKVYAATPSCVENPGEDNEDASACVTQRIDEITDFMVLVIGIVILINIVSGALMYITANGNTEKISAAKTRIMRGVAGVVMLALVETIVEWTLIE